MSWQSIIQAAVIVGLLLIAVPPLGKYIAAVHGSRGDGTAPFDRFFNPVERFIYRVSGIDERREQRWNVYALSMLAFSLVSVFVLYLMLRRRARCRSTPRTRTASRRSARSTSRSAS